MDSCELLCLDLDVAERVRDSLDPLRAQELASVFKVMADPTRLLILQALASHELCGCDLGWVTGQSEKVVSHHLGRLRREGWIESRRQGKIVFVALSAKGRELLSAADGVSV